MSSLLPPSLCPCNNVRRTCRMVVQNNPYVKIQQDKLELLAQSIISQGGQATEWDADGWHYTGSTYRGSDNNTVRQERVALYVLALDAINFCFWPHHPDDNDNEQKKKESNSLEYDHLAIALRKLAELDDDSESTDDYFFDPRNLSKLTVDEMKAALEPQLQGHYLPNIQERCRLWNELGEALLLHNHKGSALVMISTCGHSAPHLVQCIVQNFPGFRDETLYRGNWVALYKRAQIVVGDLNAALKLNLENMDLLTTFADYRVPQVLRHWGALQYNPELAAKVDSQIELDPDEEVSIRAGTVVCVDELVKSVNSCLMSSSSLSKEQMTAVTLDWHLWQVGEQMNQQGELKPHHRVKTIFY
jgi:hypothetical protein